MFCAGASILAAPFIAQSLLSESTQGSFLALLIGFALSEAWRAPSAIMIRGVAPQEMGSTASAMYLCIRWVKGKQQQGIKQVEPGHSPHAIKAEMLVIGTALEFIC